MGIATDRVLPLVEPLADDHVHGGAAAGVRARRSTGRATDREIAVVAAILDAGSEKEAAHRLDLSRSTVKHHLATCADQGRSDGDGPRTAGTCSRRSADEGSE
jgi:DNA-binding CsgD family transcriptional regulator